MDHAPGRGRPYAVDSEECRPASLIDLAKLDERHGTADQAEASVAYQLGGPCRQRLSARLLSGRRLPESQQAQRRFHLCT